MIKDQERHETQSLAEIEKRIAAANANRENNLIAKGSSTKKRMLSPRSSPSSNEIEARINAANFRREIYLTSKVEKAKTKRSPRINKTLFASISPNSDDASSVSSQGLSPRIKAARLEEFEVCCIAFVGCPTAQIRTSRPLLQQSPPSHKKDGGNHQPHGISMPLIAIGGGIAIVLVGLLSFLKR